MSDHTITQASYAERIGRTQAAVRSQGLAGLLVGVGPDLEWLTGYEAKPLERLTLLVIPPSGAPVIITPRLEVAAAEQAPGIGAGGVAIRPWLETDDPYTLVQAGLPDVRAGGPDVRAPRLLVSDTLRASFLLHLQDTFRGATFGLASPVTGPLRRAKDAAEVALLRAAAHAADRAVLGMAAGRLVGRTEADVAAEVRTRLVAEGHDRASFWIVASGPRTASPHHEPDDRVIQAGEPLLLDIGGRLGGYCSDITRTLWIRAADGSGPDETFTTIHDLVRRANRAGRDAVRPGVSAERVDAAARSIIDAAGYAAAFFHRLGHGIGVEEHEDPYLVSGNDAPLVVGDAFSIEPGIYLEGRYGVRIEDIVVCAEDGTDLLNEATRELLVVGGAG